MYDFYRTVSNKNKLNIKSKAEIKVAIITQL